MFGEGFPFDLVLTTLILFIIIGVNASKKERADQERKEFEANEN